MKRAVCGGLAAALVLGCQPAQKVRPFDASKAIETEKGYRQDGELLDRDDLWAKLKADPDTGSHVRRAKTLETVSLVLCTSAGVVLAFPLADAAGGTPDPMWELAVVGGGLFVASIPLTVWAMSSRTKAITVHNAGVGSSFYRLADSPWIVGKDSVGFVF